MNNPERTALEGIARMRGFFRSIGLPVTLKEINIGDDRLAEMAKKGTKDHPLGNFVKLYENDVLEILKLAR